MAKHKVGIIGVGHGPRLDNQEGIRNWFLKTGADVEIIERDVFTGMSFDEIHALECPKFDPAEPMMSPNTCAGGWVKREGAYDPVLGQDWYEVWTPRKWNQARIQEIIYELEDAGAQTIIMNCCLKYPHNAFKSHVPVVFPWKCTFNYVKMMAETMDHPRVALVIGRGQNVERDWLYWNDNEWAKGVEFQLVTGHLDPQSIETLKKSGPLDLVVIWGWHWFDLRDGKVGEEECLENKFSRVLGCPVISSVSAALQFARCLITPPIDEKSYLPADIDINQY